MKGSGTTRDQGFATQAVARLGAVLLLALLLAACGGGGGGGTTPPPTQNPVPTLTSISPIGANAGDPAFNLTLTGRNFISSSRVQWGGADRTTTFVSSTQLTAAIPASDITTEGSASVTVFNPTPGGGTSAAATFTIQAPSPISVLTTVLPETTGNRDYNFTLTAAQGTAPYTWSVSSGALPGGLSIDPSSGQISGNVSGVVSDTAFNFTVRAADSAAIPNIGTRDLNITVRAAGNLGRNDSCSGATPISNGRIRASISPYGDVDVYSFHGTAGKEVTIEISARRLDEQSAPSGSDSYLDSMVELLDETCPAPTLGGTSTLAWNDDIDPGIVQDSLIRVSSSPFPAATDAGGKRAPTALPYTGTYFIRVRDFRGDGRPDLIYDLSLSGAD